MAGSADFSRFRRLDLSEEEQAKKPRRQDPKRQNQGLSSSFIRFEHLSEDEKPKKTRQQNSKKENQGGGFLQGMFGGFFGPGKTSPKQSKKAEQQSVVKTQQTSNSPTLRQSFGLSNQKPAEMEEHHANQQADHDGQYHEWVDLKESGCAVSESRKRGEDLTDHARQLMEAIEDQNNEKSQLASKKYQLEEELDKTKHDVFALRHQVTTLEAEKRAKESSGDHSESERKEVDHLKQRVSELEHHLNILHEHSKKQSRTVFKLKEEAFGVEMQEEQIQSYEGLIQELEERQDHLQKELSKAHSDLKTVTKYKETIENELITLKELAFRAAAENEELRAKVVQFSESLEAKNELQRDVYKLENEKAGLKDQLEAAQAQVVSFQSDFADERRDREVAHSKLADLERELTLQKGLDRDSYWRDEATKLKTQLQEAEQHLTDLMSSQEAKEAQMEQLMKKLEEKTKELDKMTKRVNKLEEDTKSKKKKKKGSDAATPQESKDARNLARMEQLYNDASLELQEMHKELVKWQSRYTQLENQNREMELSVKALKANLKLQDKQLHQSGITTPGDPSQVSHQLQMHPHDHGQMQDIQTDEITNDGRAVPNLPIRAAAPPPLQTNTIPEFDEVTSDSASSRNHPQRPLRASHGDALPKSNHSGPSTMPQEEYYSGNLPHQVPAITIPSNQYPQGQVGGSVADQMQFQQFPQPSGVGVNPGVVPQAPAVVTPQRNDYVISNPPNVQHQPFQQQQGYAVGPPDQQALSDAHFSTSQEVLVHRMQERQRQEEQYRQLQLQQQRQIQAAQEQQRLIQEQQLLQAQQLQQQQMQAQGYQQHNQQLTYQNTNQDIPPSQQYDQGGHSRPSNIPYHQPTPAPVPERFTTDGGTPGTPEGLNFVVPQETSNSQLATVSLVGIQQKPPSVPTPCSASPIPEHFTTGSGGGVIPVVPAQIQDKFEGQPLGQYHSSSSAKKSLFELEEKMNTIEIEKQVLESERKAVITKLIEDLQLSHDRINHLDMVLVQRNKEITQLQNEVFLLHNDIEAKAKLEMDLKSTIELLNQKTLSAIESEKELEARMEVLETEKQKAISELESEKQSAAAAVQEITVSLEAEKHEKSSLQDALNKTLHQSEKMHKQSLAAIEHLQEQIKWLNKTLLLWHQTPDGRKTGDQLKHFVIQEDSEPFKYGAIVAAGCFGAVHSSTIGDIRCIAKRIHDILVGRGGQQGVSEKDRMAILANFIRECTILSTARHRNVVQFMGVHYGNEEYDISLTMEHLPTDLERFLSAYREENDHQDGFKLPLSFQVSFLSDIASGLLYLHSQSIVHRDLNSGNVLLTADLQAKIADLGVSKLHQDRKWFQKLTQAPGACGYMPPEAVAKKPVYDEKIDVFSFGVLSLYIATQNFPEILEEHVPDEIHHKGEGEIFKRQEWVDALKTQLHPFHDLVRQCLLEKKKRPQTTEVVEIVHRMHEAHHCTIQETLNVFAHFHDLMH